MRDFGGAGSRSAKTVFHQCQPVVAEIHIVAIDEDGGRAEPSPVDQLLGIVSQEILVAWLGDGGKKRRESC